MRQGTWRSLWLGGRDFAVWVVYVVTVMCALSLYEPWEDEGRAWMIARSFGLWEMLFHILRYEGHPALWYLLLWGPAHLHVPFVAINGISAAIGCAGVWVLLRYAPFPFWLRAMLPFGFWLAYQYSVVARDYALFPVLGFTVAHLYRRWPARPCWMAVALGLLANSSFYGTLVAIGFAIAYAWKLLRERGQQRWPKEATREVWWAAGVFAGSILFVAVCLWPPHDLEPPFSPTVKRTLSHVVPASYEVPQANAAQTSGEHDSTRTDFAEGTRLKTRLELIFVYPIVGLWVPSVVLELLVVAFLARRGRILLLLPLFLLCGFMGTVYSKIWHTGMVWVTLLMLVWAAWDDAPTFPWRSLQGATALLLAAAAAVQVVWTFGAIRYEIANMTYPAEATAKYLKTLPKATTLDGNKYAFTILPYFRENPFTDYDPQRYANHGLFPTDESLAQMVAYGPDVIVLRPTDAGGIEGDEEMELEIAGYSLTHKFCGGFYFPNRKSRPVCLVTFERSKRG